MLSCAFPAGCRVVAVIPTSGGEQLITLQMTVPAGVAEEWAETLKLAARMTGSDKLGAQLAAMAAECRSSWLPQNGS